MLDSFIVGHGLCLTMCTVLYAARQLLFYFNITSIYKYLCSYTVSMFERNVGYYQFCRSRDIVTHIHKVMPLLYQWWLPLTVHVSSYLAIFVCIP